MALQQRAHVLEKQRGARAELEVLGVREKFRKRMTMTRGAYITGVNPNSSSSAGRELSSRSWYVKECGVGAAFE